MFIEHPLKYDFDTKKTLFGKLIIKKTCKLIFIQINCFYFIRTPKQMVYSKYEFVKLQWKKGLENLNCGNPKKVNISNLIIKP